MMWTGLRWRVECRYLALGTLNLRGLLPETDLTRFMAQPLTSVSAFRVIHQRAYSTGTGLGVLLLSLETYNKFITVSFYRKRSKHKSRSSSSFTFFSSPFVRPSWSHYPVCITSKNLGWERTGITFQIRRCSPCRSVHSLCMLWSCRSSWGYSPASHRCGLSSIPNYAG